MKKKIKIAMITTNFELNGISSIIMNYCRNINLEEFDITIFVGEETNNYYLNECKALNIEIRILHSKRKNKLKYYFDLFRKMKKREFDICHVHGNSSTMVIDLLIAYLRGIKIRIAHSHNSTCEHKKIDKLLRPFFYKCCTNYFACGNDAGKWLYENRSFELIPNGNNLEKFKFNENNRELIRNKYNLNGKKVFGHVGRFNNQKNQNFLIELFMKYQKNNANSKLVLIGDGKNIQEIREKVFRYKLEDKVIFTGEISNVEEWLSACDVMLLPSRYEGLPLVLVEWQACGLPCLVSDVVTKEVRITDLVYLISLENENEWILKMNEINETNRKQKSYDGIKILEQNGYSIKKNVKKLEKLYKNLLKNRDY